MANSKLQGMARIRAYCTGESYQKALSALAEGGGNAPHSRGAQVQQDVAYREVRGGNSLFRTCPECDLDTFLDTRDELLPKHLGLA